jgi:hypothetical protein
LQWLAALLFDIRIWVHHTHSAFDEKPYDSIGPDLGPDLAAGLREILRRRFRRWAQGGREQAAGAQTLRRAGR